MAVFAVIDAYFRGGPLHGEVMEVDHPLPEEIAWYEHHYELSERIINLNGNRYPVYQHDDAHCCDRYRDGVYADEEDPECE